MGHREALQRAGAPGEPALSRLERYLDLVATWSARVNLTAARTAESRVAVLVVPALALARVLQPGPLLDVGSGNGSPGLVLALLDPQRPVTLLEPRSRRWAFLREAARAGGRPDVIVLRRRHDEYEGPPAANVTLRALRLPPSDIVRLLAPGGQALLSAPVPGASRWGDAEGVFVLRSPAVPRGT